MLERFQQRYYSILGAQQNHLISHDKLKSFIYCAVGLKPIDIKEIDFNFHCDANKQKLIFSITGNLCNRDASHILHFFRTYDEQAIWYLMTQKGTVREFVLDPEAMQNHFLNDFENYVKGVLSGQDLYVRFMSSTKEYIKPAALDAFPNISTRRSLSSQNLPGAGSEDASVSSEQLSMNTVSKKHFNTSSTSTCLKFAGLFAIGLTATAACSILMSDNESSFRKR